MTNVFLSYDRDDMAKARSIALALEKAGHSVWWDRHIKSGAQYSKEIEEALKRADAVVVLWSERSVDSAWVRDEAAAGRDTGRLVPVTIGKAEPPLGFRQYQTTDLSHWKGRSASAQFREMLDAIEDLGGSSGTEAPAIPVKSPNWRARLPYFHAAAVAAILIAGLIVWQPWAPWKSAPVVAVAPAGPSPAARSLARDLFAKLGNLQSAKTDSLELVQGGDGHQDADFTFEVDTATSDRLATANLVLLGGKDRTLLWSKDFEQPVAKKGDLKQQLAYTAAKVLECAVEGLASESASIRQETLKLYLNGCSAYSEMAGADPSALVQVFRKVVEQAPKFEGAWAKLIYAETEIALSVRWEDNTTNMRPALLRHLTEARKLNPDMAAILLAEADLAPPGAFGRRMQLLERAVEQNPENSEALSVYSYFLISVGRNLDSIEQAKNAVRLDPLSPLTLDTLINALTYAGRTDEALEELRKAERLWPGASNLLSSSYRLHLRYGDPEKAVRIQRIGNFGNPSRDAFLRARIDPSPANIETAISHSRRWFQVTPTTISSLAQALAAFDKEEELFAILLNWRHPEHVNQITGVLFRPDFRNFHRDPRMIAVAQRLGLLDYWRQSGEWPDFCFQPDLPYNCKAEAAKLPTRASR